MVHFSPAAGCAYLGSRGRGCFCAQHLSWGDTLAHCLNCCNVPVLQLGCAYTGSKGCGLTRGATNRRFTSFGR
eukprot:scaffold254184_cov23-Tisochrysis_lutea.AAC.1